MQKLSEKLTKFSAFEFKPFAKLELGVNLIRAPPSFYLTIASF